MKIKNKKGLIAIGLLSLGLGVVCNPATADSAASEPAVSEPNAKFSLSGLSLDGRGATVAQGLFTAPLGHSFGVQIDAEGGLVNSEAYAGTGAHLFWRDPNVGLLGVAYSYQNWNNANFGYLNGVTPIIKDLTLHRGGIQAELYLSRFTLSGYGGYQDGTAREGGFGHLVLKYYATDDLSVNITGDHLAGTNLIRGGAEFRPNFTAIPNLAFFAEGGYGSHDFGMAQAGIRYYFGKSTPTLINRDRRSDPIDLFVSSPQQLIQDQSTPATPATPAGCPSGEIYYAVGELGSGNPPVAGCYIPIPSSPST